MKLEDIINRLWPRVPAFSQLHSSIVRRVFPSLVASELVSVQPMSAPSGLLFYLDYTYGKSVSLQDVCERIAKTHDNN